MQISINIKDDSMAKTILWFLEHFKDDGIEIIKSSIQENKQAYTDEYVKENWRTIISGGLKDLNDGYYKSEQYKIDRGEYLMEKNK